MRVKVFHGWWTDMHLLNWLFTCIMVLVAGILVGILIGIGAQDTRPVIRTPDAIVPINGERCAVWKGEFQGAAMYAVHCKGRPLLFTRDYLYQSNSR